MVHITQYPNSYLTFSNLVERAGVRCSDQTSLTVLKESEFLLIFNNIPDNLTIRNNRPFILPSGFKVKRGFEVDSTDHVHEHENENDHVYLHLLLDLDHYIILQILYQ